MHKKSIAIIVLIVCLNIIFIGCQTQTQQEGSATPTLSTSGSEVAESQESSMLETKVDQAEAIVNDSNSSIDETAKDATDSATSDTGNAASSSIPDTLKEQLVFGDDLAAGWQEWSWNTQTNYDNNAPVRRGQSSISVTIDSAWSAFYLHIDPVIDFSEYDLVRFWIHGGEQGGQSIRLVLADAGANFLGESLKITPQADQWTLVEAKLDQLGKPDGISGLALQDAAGQPQSTFYIDDLAFVDLDLPPPPTPAPAVGPVLHVDAAAQLHKISPEIYGINYAEESLAAELKLPVRRWGGNATTRYNWQLDVANRASDWFFENIPEENGNLQVLPAGSAADRFVQQNQRTGTATILTMPLIGWTPASRVEACAFSVTKYGAQQATDPWRPDCGNGLDTDGLPITNNEPQDTSIAVGPDFVADWVGHLTRQFGTAAEGGVAYYALDNEPMLWHHTHRDVHPEPVGYDELRDLTYEYAAAIKKTDPTAQTLGPVVWGWTAYEYSALDAQAGGRWWNNAPDRRAHNGTALVPWYLQQMRKYEEENGVRILDYLDLHYYPAAQGVALSPVGGADVRELRLRTTRSLWDERYVDESWIDEPVRLIPRMREWVDQNYPGTKIALTEYNWGALDHINGALAQADVLGIFGREQLDLATLWAPLAADQPWAFAFRMYRNYDGQGSMFGDQSIAAASDDQRILAVYAAQRDDGALTVMIINKSDLPQSSRLSLKNFTTTRPAEVYQYSAAHPAQIVRAPDQPLVSGATDTLAETTLPPQSITLLVIE